MTKNKITSFVLLLIILSATCYAQESAYGPKIIKDNYIISRSKVDRVLNEGDVFTDFIEIENLGTGNLEASFSVSEGLIDIVEFTSTGIIIGKDNSTSIGFLIKGIGPQNYSGTINIQGDVNEVIDVKIIVEEDTLESPLLLEVEFLKNKFILDKYIEFNLKITKLKPEEILNATFNYNLIDKNNKTYFLGSEKRDIFNNFQVVKRFQLPENLEEGEYILETTIDYNKRIIFNKTNLLLKRGFFKIKVFGFIPMWLIFVVLGLLLTGFLLFYLLRQRSLKKKKYQMKLDLKTIPQKNPDFLYLGKIAETNHPAYLDPNRLTTHSIVAGATGGGKSISAQVIIEEALMHNISVIVFDPTAQWSGMLRKCDDKKMMSYYPKFGLKETDSRAFKGNVRQVKNAREIINIKKYMSPGQIHIFTLNKLDPNDMDIFVSSVIRQIFRSDPQESPVLKVILVFDEVHRLLSKFGGSGQGFLQVERACREFRKWGLGVVLISQVLNDFVGEIKANINTEIQTRTLEEGDLDRIKTKYGEEFLKSLVRAEVGVAMFQNAEYNRGKPYFINFRPILHNTRRLSDEELDKYNKYNDIVDDLEYQIEQLEKEKVDAFDLKMELKLVKDKIMTGNFSVVEIYLEGLIPRVQKEWQKLGKKPKKREIQLIAEDEIKKSIEEAKQARAKFEKQESKNKPAEKKEEEPKEKIEDKELKPLTFDNGVMVGRLKELKDVLPNMDEEIFKTHVNETKNDIAEWIKQLSPEFAQNIQKTTNKQELTQKIDAFIKLGGKLTADKKPPKPPKKEGEKKEQTKKPPKTQEKQKETTNKQESKEEKKEVK